MPDEIENPDVRLARALPREHAARLSERLDDEHSRHHGMAREMAHWKCASFALTFFSATIDLPGSTLEHAIDEQERIAMRQALEDRVDVEDLASVSVIFFLLLVPVSARQGSRSACGHALRKRVELAEARGVSPPLARLLRGQAGPSTCRARRSTS